MSGLFPLSGAQGTVEDRDETGPSRTSGGGEGLIAALKARQPGRIRPSLDGLRSTLERFSDPQRAFRSILVVGTNGKGSTAAMLERLLASTGAKTGLYTSPHLVAPTERLRCNGEDIHHEALTELISLFDPFPQLTYFETLTAAAFVFFAREGVDVAVLEAGMGGQWDATRLAASAIAGLTNIGSDHPKWLGTTREAVAADKGAALAAAHTAILGPGVDAAIREHLGAPAARHAETVVAMERTSGPSTVRVRWADGPWATITCPLAGRHQLDNLHLALALAVAAGEHGWIGDLEPRSVHRALAGVRWPGRWSSATVNRRPVVLDGAHNIESVSALVAHLRTLSETHNLLFTCLDDKPVEAMADLLRPVIGTVAIFEIDDERAMPLDRLRAAFPEALVGSTAMQALGLLDPPVIAAGSLRLVGDLLREGASDDMG